MIQLLNIEHVATRDCLLSNYSHDIYTYIHIFVPYLNCPMMKYILRDNDNRLYKKHTEIS